MRNLAIRAVTRSDSELLLTWRNDPSWRLMARNTHLIKPEDHEHWLEDALSDQSRWLFMVERDGKPVGHVRVDRVRSSDPEITVCTAPESRGEGIAKYGIDYVCQDIHSVNPGVKVIAWVKEGNIASQALFESAGFDREILDDGWRLFTRQMNNSDLDIKQHNSKHLNGDDE